MSFSNKQQEGKSTTPVIIGDRQGVQSTLRVKAMVTVLGAWPAMAGNVLNPIGTLIENQTLFAIWLARRLTQPARILKKLMIILKEFKFKRLLNLMTPPVKRRKGEIEADKRDPAVNELRIIK